MAVKLELFYSPTCPLCPRVRELVISLDDEVLGNVQVEEVNVYSSEGLKRAESYGIRSVPAMILNGKVKLTGVPTKSTLVNAVQRELGGKT